MNAMIAWQVRAPGNTLATVDHNVPTSDRSAFESVETFIKEMESQTQVPPPPLLTARMTGFGVGLARNT